MRSRGDVERRHDRPENYYPGQFRTALDPGSPLTLGERVTVGHAVVLHGCTIGDGA
ncbi:MAG: hypothetical protein R3F24_07285 [Gammaproteobacteria bacterium]